MESKAAEQSGFRQRTESYEHLDAAWREGIDSRSKRTYYFNLKSGETCWHKPPALMNLEEREVYYVERNERKDFFSAMERNIKIRMGVIIPGPSDPIIRRNLSFSRLNSVSRKQEARDSTRMHRTISSVDDELILLARRQSLRERPGDAMLESIVDIFQKVPKHARKASGNQLRRRNSSGTLYIDSTITQPDELVTIRCVCAVILAHIESGLLDENMSGDGRLAFNNRAGSPPTMMSHFDSSVNLLEDSKLLSAQADARRRCDDDLKLFDDALYFAEVADARAEEKASSSNVRAPSIHEVTDFFTLIHQRSMMENDTIIMALIYVERLSRKSNGNFVITCWNWRSIIFMSLIMSSKVWDDLSMWNVDFSGIFERFTLRVINMLEIKMLEILRYSVRVSAGEYARYYFHLRSLAARLGHHDSDNVRVQPLDLKGARRLALGSDKYQCTSSTMRRNTSLLDMSRFGGNQGHDDEGKNTMNSRNTTEISSFTEVNPLVGLEQLLHGAHLDADGKRCSPGRARSRFFSVSDSNSFTNSPLSESFDTLRVSNRSPQSPKGFYIGSPESKPQLVSPRSQAKRSGSPVGANSSRTRQISLEEFPSVSDELPSNMKRK
jgi:hypothetical protein